MRRLEAAAALTARRGVLEKRFCSGALSGLGFARGLSAAQDHFVRRLCRAQGSLPFSVLAVGGYGRGLLAPHSDVDLLFLVDGRGPLQPNVEAILHPLWDLGFQATPAVRTARTCLSLAREDLTIRTSLLDGRLLWGEEAAFARLMRRLMRRLVQRLERRAFVAARLAARAQPTSRYLVEPDVKEGKGGLRDLDTLGWIAKAMAKTWHPGGDLSVLLTPLEQRQFQQCLGFLWTVRAHLHVLAGRGEEILSFDLQPSFARALGAGDSPQGVEKVMRRYFLTTRQVGALLRSGCAALERKRTLRPRRWAWPTWSKRPPGFCVDRGRLTVTSPQVFKAPLRLLEFFHVACVRELRLHPVALRYIRLNLWRLTPKVRRQPQAGRVFLEILTARQGPERILRAMNETGLLGRFFPPFGRVVALMQFNRYHHYTVDEHLLRAVGCLSQMERGEGDSFTTSLAADVSDRAVLYLSVFVHDIAKGRDGDHSQVGARLAVRFARRLGLDASQAATVSWLVAHHLLMSRVSQTRDLNDPKTVEDFVDQIQDVTRLRLLYLLTEADMRAVGPGTWSGWKARLLRSLFVQAASTLKTSARPTPRVTQRYEEFRRAVPSAPPVSSQSPGYWLSFDVPTLVRHACLDPEPHGFALDLRPDPLREVSELTFKAPDHPGLFFRLAGACALLRLSVVEARIFTARDGMALDVLWVQNEAGHLVETLRLEAIRKLIKQVITGTRRLPKRFASSPRPQGGEPEILIDNTASHTHTVLEVRGPDRAGLLYEIARTLYEAGLSLSSARAATFGDKVVDVFYVQDLVGHKLTSVSRQRRVHQALLRVLAP